MLQSQWKRPRWLDLSSSIVMDVHRSRFVPYPTSAISAIAFSRSSDSGFAGPLSSLKLAIGRVNGDIEIWNPLKGSWVQETILPGDGRSIDGVAWTQDPDETDAEGNITAGQQRLFSISSSPAVTEWDLATGQVKRRSTGNFSEVWCFATQPRWKPRQGKDEEAQPQDIVAGCGDGTLVVLSTADNDLQFKRNLARVSGKKARCMCVTYQNWDTVVAGFADSIIRLYDTRNNALVRQMSLGMGIPGAPKNALVWQVRCLPNGDIVSGDSNGEVRFWDGKNYSLLQRITAHETDCLDLVTSNDGKTVFSGSMDGRIAVHRLSNSENGRKSWAKHSHRRMHSGEVKAMAAFDSKNMSVVVSGGSDAAPIVTPLRENGKENHRTLSVLPQEPPVASAPKARLLVSWAGKTISIWRIARRPTEDTVEEPQRPRKLVAQLNIAGRDNIRSVSISVDGKVLAAATSSEIKIFQLRKRPESDRLTVRKLEVPDDLADSGARSLNFSPDCKWLVAVTPESEVQIVRLAPESDHPKRLRVVSRVVELDRHHRRQVSQSGFKDYDRAISRIAFAADSSVLVTGDLSGYLDSWVLEGHEDLTAPALDAAKHDSDKASSVGASDSASSSDSSDDEDEIAVFYGQHWTVNPAGHMLPKLDSAPLVLTFRPPRTPQQHTLTNGNPGIHATRHNPHAHSHELPHGQHKLFVVTARHQMYEFDILAGKLSEWSRRNSSDVLPEDFKKLLDRVISAVWDVTEQRERMWLYGSGWVWMLNVGSDLREKANSQSLMNGKRKRRGSETNQNKRRKPGSGAGGAIPLSRREGALSTARKHENGKWADVNLDREAKRDDDDDDEDVTGLQLTRLESTDGGKQVDEEAPSERKWWFTYKYRPILGMVPLEDEDDRSAGRPFEVVIVERPLVDSRAGKR